MYNPSMYLSSATHKYKWDTDSKVNKGQGVVTVLNGSGLKNRRIS